MELELFEAVPGTEGNSNTSFSSAETELAGAAGAVEAAGAATGSKLSEQYTLQFKTRLNYAIMTATNLA